MTKLHVRTEYPHRFPPDEARKRLLRLVHAIAADYPGYHLKHGWMDDGQTAISFDFEKESRGRGGGVATLREASVVVEFHAQVKLPFFVPAAMAEWRVREELAKALRESFD